MSTLETPRRNPNAPPAISPRQTIGPYQIVERVGAGGMGEVFKAWDPRLERHVAIKLLHPETAADPDRQKRLVAEGRAASALNHPNLVRVYDADVDGDSYYLVSEWLEGKSLRDELSRGALPVKRLLDLAVQIADGLVAAHAAGIVHRDIKPENIMLARDGTARIVDFGLARSDAHAAAMSAAAGSAPTVTASVDGRVSGTPAYMSPEQARGTAGDFRADQFSFGAMLYEMATGKFAFRRDTMADTLSAVLHDEPRAIAAINPRVPTAVTWIIEQCLAKDAAERYAATEDLARELRRVRERLRETTVESLPQARPSPSAWILPMVAGFAAALIVALAGLAFFTRAPAPDLRFTPMASGAGYEGKPIWSPDGQSLAWIADVDGVLQVFVRRLTDAVATQLTHGLFDADEPFWAPDGSRLYFISGAGSGVGLWQVGSAGGRAELVLENVTHADIDPTGQRLALLRLDLDTTLYQRLWWASANGENPVREMRAPFADTGYGLGGLLRFRPDGQQLLFWAFSAVQRPDQRVSSYYLVSTAPDGPVREVLSSVRGTANVQPVSWFPDNRHVALGLADTLSGTRHLWIADTESDSLRRLTATHTNETWPSVSPDGRRIAYASQEVDFDLVAVGEDGRSRRNFLTTARNEMDPAWSPIGDQHAFVTDRAGDMEIWVRSNNGQWERPIVTAADFGATRTETLGALAFSPDGRRLAFQRRGPDQAHIYLTPATGGAPVRLVEASLPEFGGKFQWQDAPAWSPDGEWISFVYTPGSDFSLGKVRVGTKEIVTLLDLVVPFTRPAWSPDGRWIVADTLKHGLVVVPAEGGTPQTVYGDPVLAFTWAPDSRRIVALAESEVGGHIAMVSIDRTTGDAITLNPDLGTIPVANQPIRGFSYLKGQGYLTSLASARSDIWLLEGFTPFSRGLFSWLRR